MPYYKEEDLLTIGNHYRCLLYNYLTIGLLQMVRVLSLGRFFSFFL